MSAIENYSFSTFPWKIVYRNLQPTRADPVLKKSRNSYYIWCLINLSDSSESSQNLLENIYKWDDKQKFYFLDHTFAVIIRDFYECSEDSHIYG